ncbi:hypothetical protein [Aliidiomarina quisquiliarum]|uniref:hypothetical protein n=1 Tax=Aliidiomarina quisquiliarum TaxID=2938947 RepID=UPI00208F846A|nr:hypothetical protein [Aliidiomarina quisquiliarum]MCO4319946.1 hypothetical protein [Aliidiomarina quisquiliarum]
MKLKYIVIVLTFLLATAGVSAQVSVSYQGTLNVVPIQPILSHEHDEILAGVFRYNLNVENESSICEFVSDKALAAGSLDTTNWRCHFEWTSEINGIENQGTKIAGVFPVDGAIDIPYQVSVYSGSNEQKVIVWEGVYELTVAAPERPVYTDIRIDWQTETLRGLDQFIGSPKAAMKVVEIFVEPQDYRQSVTFRDKSCTINTGRTSCRLSFDREEIAGIGQSGQLVYDLKLDSEIPYFADNLEQLIVSYDYRPPEFYKFYVNDSLDYEGIVVDTASNTFDLDFNQAAIVYTVSQSDENNPWWLPRDKSLSLIAASNSGPSNFKSVMGRSRFFNIPYFSRATNQNVEISNILYMDGEVAFIYDLSEIGDGRYTPNFNPENLYGVGSFTGELEEFTISRHPPQLEFFTRVSTVNDAAELYFGSDMAIVAYGGWEDGSAIVDVSIDGQPVQFESHPDDPQIVHIAQNEIEQLTPGESYLITALAQNANGASTERNVTMNYAPAQFEVGSVPDSLYRKVEPVHIGVNQIKGAKCNFVSSREIALEATTASNYSCYVEWESVPEGMASIFSSRKFYLYGSVHVDMPSVNFGASVVYVNHLGHELKLHAPSQSTTLLDPQPIDLGIEGRLLNDEGVILLSEGTRELGRARIGFTRGVVEYEVSYREQEPYIARSISSGRDYVEGTIRLNALQTHPHEIFTSNEIIIKAWYRYAPEMSVERREPFIFMPNDATRFILSSDKDEGNTLESLHLNASLEKPFGREWVTDPALIGNYKIHIAKQIGMNEFEPITESKPLENGFVSFEVPLSEGLDLGNNTLYAIATLDEPDAEGVDSELVSRRFNFYLFSGAAIEGEINSRTLEGPIPMTAKLSYQTKTLHEARLIEEYIWEYSEDDGETWTIDESVTNHSFSRNHEEAADYLVRVRVRNRLTGLESQSEEVRVIAYHTPRITIDGPTAVYRGLPQTFAITGVRSALNAEDGRFFWSFDREEWIEGEPEIELELTEPTRLYAKFISHTADGRDLQRSAEVEAVRSIQVRRLSPVSIAASLPSLVEAGTVIDMNARVRHAITSLDMPLAVEWVDSDGNIYENGHEYEITENDINDDNSAEFLVRAWMVGLKEKTYSERTVRTRPWSYTTPEISVEIRSSHQIAPVNLRLGISHPLIFAPLVDIEYDWELPEGATITRTNSGGRYINVDFTEPGVYEVKGILRDSRGGESVAYEYVEVLEPAEMEPKLDVRFSETHMRPPLRAVGRVSVERTHPDDRVNHIVWFLNGEQIGEPRSTGYVDLEEAGTFELKAEIHTRLGQIATVTEMVTLSPNQPPVCVPLVTETSTAFRVETNCTDDDGRIVRYEWEWLDGTSSQNRPTLSFSKTNHETLSVTFRAYDDSGDYAEHAVSW